MVVEQEIIRYDQIRHVNAYVRKVHFLNEHMHGSFELSYVLEGSAQYRHGQKTRNITPGTLILVNPYETHSYATLDGTPLVLLTVQIHKQFARRYIESIPRLRFKSWQLFDLPKQSRKELSKLVIQIADAYFSDDYAKSFDVIAYALLLGRLSTMLDYEVDRHPDNTDNELQKNRIYRLIDYIDENYRQKITLSVLADMEGITPTYLSHLFKKFLGVSFQSYLTMLRLEKALILMRDESLSLVDICMNCGFSDSRYLETACKKTFGCSVSEYRERWMERNKQDLDVSDGHLYKQYGTKESVTLIQTYLEEHAADLQFDP